MLNKKQYKKYSLKTQKKNNILFSKNVIGLLNYKFDFITIKQIESIRKLIIRKLKKIVTVVIKVHCLLPITKKTIGIRMGKGSGSINNHICYIKPGIVFLEFFNLETKLLKKVLKQLQKKINLSVCILKRSFFFKINNTK